jgi:hypothetical protein
LPGSAYAIIIYVSLRTIGALKMLWSFRHPEFISGSKNLDADVVKQALKDKQVQHEA